MIYSLNESAPLSRDSSYSPTTHRAPGDYCSNPKLNEELAMLHGALLYENKDVQIEIDRRLVACIAADDGWECDPRYKHVPIEWLYTHPDDTIQYNRLPDIARFICGHNFSSCKVLNAVIQGAMPCMRKGRILLNPFDLHEKNPAHSKSNVSICDSIAITYDSELSACINMLYGTLFGLYPSCSKHPTFNVRKNIFRVLRSVSNSSPEYQRAFLSQITCILRLSVMEYIVNVTTDYCPAEYNYLSQIKGMDVYYGTCTNMCDTFRTETLQGGGADMEWSRIEEHASVLIERFTRTCKFRIQREAPTELAMARKTIQTWRKSITTQEQRAEAIGLLNASLKLPSSMTKGGSRIYMNHLRDDSGVGATINPDAMSGNNISSSVIDALHSNVRCYSLPGNIIKKSCESLLGIAWNPQKLYSVSHVNMCMWCINRTSQGPSSNALSSSFRMNVDEDVLTCATCTRDENDNTPKTVIPPTVSVNMVGRLLSVGNRYHFLCPGCCKVRPWEATGCEFSGKCKHTAAVSKSTRIPKSARITSMTHEKLHEHSLNQNNEMKIQTLSVCNRILNGVSLPWTPMPPIRLSQSGITQYATFSSSQIRGHQYSCLFCSKNNACNMVRTLHIDKSPRIVSLFLCNKHRIYDHMQQYIHDTTSLSRMIASG